MTPDEMFVNQNFYYPLGLLLVGGIISSVLIPFFNFLNKRKLLDVARAHEEAQKSIDRAREDYKFELEIKERILQKLSKIDERAYSHFEKMIGKTSEERNKIFNEYMDDSVNEDNEIRDYIVLYFNSNENLFELWKKIDFIRGRACHLMASEVKTPQRKRALEKLIEVMDITMDEKGRKDAMEKDDFPESIFKLFRMIRTLKLEFKKTKMN